MREISVQPSAGLVQDPEHIGSVSRKNGAVTAAPGVRIQLLGSLRLWRGECEIPLGTQRQNVVLALLVLAGGQPLSLADLMTALWPDSPPASAINVVQTYVKRLRHILEPERPARAPSAILPTVGDGYALDLSTIEVDLARFREMVAAARHSEDRHRAAELLGAALSLWHASPVAGLPELATHPTVAALTEQRRAAALRYADAMIDLGAAADAVPALEQLVGADPLDEGAVAALVRACHAAGQRARAINLYHRARRRLADELGVDPGPELVSAYAALLKDSAPTGAGSGSARPAALPADTVAVTGRARELHLLDRMLAEAHSRPTAMGLVAIVGPGGVGKTTLAVHWAHTLAPRFPDGQLYVNLCGFGPQATVMGTAEAVRGFLDALGVSTHRIPPAVESQVDLFRSLLAGRHMLIVLDNARDAGQVRALLPGAAGCLVVVTSRNRLSGLVAVEGARLLTLGLLSADSSRQLLADRIGPERVAAEPRAVDRIVGHCARLPLAMAVVAAHAATRPAIPLNRIADELRGTQHRLDGLTDADERADVRAAFAWSYRVLDPAPARLFRLLGLPSAADIGLAAAGALAGLDAGRTRALADELARGHLVAETAPDRYRMHDLVRAYAAELTEIEDDASLRRAALRRLLDHYLYTAHTAALMINPQLDPIELPLEPPAAAAEPIPDLAHALSWLATERHTLLAAAAQAAAAGFPAHAWQLAWALFHFLLRRGYWQDLQDSQRIGLAAAQELGHLAAQAFSRRRLSTSLITLGRFMEAGVLLESALDIYRDLSDDLSQAHVYADLNRRYAYEGRHDDALPHALAAAERYAAAGHATGHAAALNLAGWNLAVLGDFESAMRYGQQALDLSTRTDDRHTLAATWDTVGYVHQHRGEYREAIGCYRRSLDLFREVGDRYSESVTLDHLGDCHEANADPQHARQMWVRALNILHQLGHPDAERVRDKLRRRPIAVQSPSNRNR